MLLQRHPDNPILLPGTWPWRGVTTFNPGVVIDDDGSFLMLERAVSSLAPLHSHFGLLRSSDGVHFEHVVDQPVFTAAMLGAPRGTVEDPRIVKIGGRFVMTYVFRSYASSCFPNGVGVPDYHNPVDVPPGDPNNYRSGIAVSDDAVDWQDQGLMTPPEVDDRDCVLFPEQIDGDYLMLRRPQVYDGPQFGGLAKPSIWVSRSRDLQDWSAPQLVAEPVFDWEHRKIGAAAQPLATEAGWLTFYHGVDADGRYRTGLMLLDRDDPSRVIARCPEPIFGPERSYERVGLIIPNVVFPSANVVKADTIFIYYGCCDTTIALATVGLGEALDHVRRFPC